MASTHGVINPQGRTDGDGRRWTHVRESEENETEKNEKTNENDESRCWGVTVVKVFVHTFSE